MEWMQRGGQLWWLVPLHPFFHVLCGHCVCDDEILCLDAISVGHWMVNNAWRWKTNDQYRRYSTSLCGGGCSGCGIRHSYIPGIVFLDVHIIHTSIQFSKVTIAMLNKVIGVLLQQIRKRIRLVLNLGC